MSERVPPQSIPMGNSPFSKSPVAFPPPSLPLLWHHALPSRLFPHSTLAPVSPHIIFAVSLIAYAPFPLSVHMHLCHSGVVVVGVRPSLFRVVLLRRGASHF